MMVSEFDKELVRAFNIISEYGWSDQRTNFTVERLHGQDCIAMEFGESTEYWQRNKYLNVLGETIIKGFYGTGGGEKTSSFDLNQFPFNPTKKITVRRGVGIPDNIRIPIVQEVKNNIKCYIAHSFTKDIKQHISGRKRSEKMSESDERKYIMFTYFEYKESASKFKEEFSAELARVGYKCSKNPVEVKGHHAYIRRDIFDDLNFIKKLNQYLADIIVTANIGDYEYEGFTRGKMFIKRLSTLITNATGVHVDEFDGMDSGMDSGEFILEPVVHDTNGKRYLNNEEVGKINKLFGYPVVNVRLLEGREVYALDFSNAEICYNVLTTMMEKSIIHLRDGKYVADIDALPLHKHNMAPLPLHKHNMAPPPILINPPVVQPGSYLLRSDDYQETQPNSEVFKGGLMPSTTFGRPSLSDSGVGSSKSSGSVGSSKSSGSVGSSKSRSPIKSISPVDESGESALLDISGVSKQGERSSEYAEESNTSNCFSPSICSGSSGGSPNLCSLLVGGLRVSEGTSLSNDDRQKKNEKGR
jgi:hypothetical protein